MATASRDDQVNATRVPHVIRLSGTRARDPGVRRVYRRPDGTVAWWDGGRALRTNRGGYLWVDPTWSVERMAMYLDDHASCLPFHS